MTENKASQSECLKFNEVKEDINEQPKNQEKSKIVSSGEEVECNLQTPLMFSRCSSLGSLSGFEQHSVHDDHSSIKSDFSTRTSRAVSPAMNQNEFNQPSTRSSVSSVDHVTQGNQQKIQSNRYFPKKSIQTEKLNSSHFSYDAAFKKPHFMKYSVFEDDIAAFKDESSPYHRSTAASSLSSLTIDDDDYGENGAPNKAGLVKKRSNFTDLPQVHKNIPIQEQWRQDPIGGACEPQTIQRNEQKQIFNIQHNEFQQPYVQREDNGKKSNQQIHAVIEEQFKKEDQIGVNSTGYNINHSRKSNWYGPIQQYSRNVQKIRVEAEGSQVQFPYRNELHIQLSERDKFKNTQVSQILVHQRENIESINSNLYNKSNRCEKCNEQEFCQTSYKTNNDHHTEESTDLNAYEEQLLDQCIRRGMAKVTKRNISEIKPFCWDLNQICLTTRAMLKINDDDFRKDRRDERNKRRTSQRTVGKRVANTRTK